MNAQSRTIPPYCPPYLDGPCTPLRWLSLPQDAWGMGFDAARAGCPRKAPPFADMYAPFTGLAVASWLSGWDSGSVERAPIPSADTINLITCAHCGALVADTEVCPCTAPYDLAFDTPAELADWRKGAV
jgi:hypothetical protein